MFQSNFINQVCLNSTVSFHQSIVLNYSRLLQIYSIGQVTVFYYPVNLIICFLIDSDNYCSMFYS